MHHDDRGLALTTDSAEAAALFNRGINEYFEYRLSTGKTFKSVVEADPDFAFGHCLRGYLFMLFGTTAVHDAARGCLAAAEAKQDGATARERTHIAALAAWLTGNMEKTCGIWQEILVEYPTDLLALRLQNFANFWSGDCYLLRDGVAQVANAWDPDLPGYGNLQGMLAFGLEECGDYAPAERMGREAVERNPEDLWAIHAVAHVLEMQGRLDDGKAWMDYPADQWADRNPFRGHLWWHAALFSFEKGDYDTVLALYDRSIRTEKSDFYLDIQNQAALLYRLELQGVDIGDRWGELADYLENRLDDHILAFTDLHSMMALAAAGRTQATQGLLGSLRDFAATPGNSAAATMKDVTLPLCEAFVALREGEAGRAVDLMLPIRHRWSCVGGSHAQRDLFHQLLVEAAVQAGRLPLARALLSERITLKPNSLGNWRKLAGVLQDLELTEEADAARARMADLS